MNLTDNEYKDLLTYFSQKYGSYELDDQFNYCEWKLSEKDGKVGYEDGEIGFDEIVLLDDGDKKYRVCFSDEWTGITDEAYYEALEESQNSESEWVTLESQECEYDGV